MAKYTTEVRTICENYAGYSPLSGGTNVADIIEKSREKIFDFNFPIFDEKYRSVLETKILKHFYTREIGLETVGLWKLKLDTKLNEIMPYYNQMYKSTLLEFNPLYDVDISRVHSGSSTGDKNSVGKNTHTYDMSENFTNNGKSDLHSTGSNNGNTTNTSSGNTSQLDKYSDTPQGEVTNLLSGTYLTNARQISDEETNNSNETSSNNTSLNENQTSTNNGETERSENRKVSDEKKETLKNTEEYIETVKGKQGSVSYSKLLQEFRETFINIDMLVIEDLTDLFLNLW